MASKAHDILGPLDPGTMRVVFLYVGQGEATLLLIPDGNDGHISMLVDCNHAGALGGVDLSRFLSDLLPTSEETEKPHLDYFANTHPHKDHLGGLESLQESVSIGGVWHSGHRPGREYDGPYQELRKLIAVVEKAGGEVRELAGSRTATALGLAEVHVLAPAAHVTDDIDGETAEARYQRIHEQCAVLRFSYGEQPSRILVTGDSDKAAWRDHISYHHADAADNRVQSDVLSASHHGSRTFFKVSEHDEDPYTAHLEAIGARHLIISAPDVDDSPHDHPHEDALVLYKKHVAEDCIWHMGSSGQSFVVDIDPDGTYDIRSDNGELADAYGRSEPEDDGGGSKRVATVEVISRVERSRPMG